MVSSPSFNSMCLSLQHDIKTFFPNILRLRAALRSAYSRWLHLQKALSQMYLTLEGRTSCVIPESDKQLSFSASKPSFNLTEIRSYFAKNAFWQMVVIVGGNVYVLFEFP